MAHVPDAFYGSVYGVCHQGVNASLLSAGLSDTAFSLYPGWDTFLSTAIYGNYGGGLVRSTYAGISAAQEFRRDEK